MTKKAYRHYSVEEICEALTRAKGIASVAAEILGCSRQTVYDKIRLHPEVREAQDQADESVTDFAEGKLMQKLSKGDMRAIIFRLETKGKRRGYIRRQEMSGPDGGAIPSEFTLTFTK